jgi:hypothetical protein
MSVSGHERAHDRSMTESRRTKAYGVSTAIVTLALSIAAVSGCASRSEVDVHGSVPSATAPLGSADCPAVCTTQRAPDNAWWLELAATLQRLHFSSVVPGPGRVGVGIR